MKKIYFSFLILALCFACQNTSSNQDRQKFVEDSISREKDRIAQERIEREKHIQDSINSIIIAEKESLFEKKTDEFSDNTWVFPKTRPKYRDRNGAYCYFATKDGKPENLRFVFQYYADDWLFIKNMIFNFDGENVRIIPDDMETDCGNGGMIWEWCDNHVYGGSEEYVINEAFIKKFLTAKEVKVKLNGSQYYNERKLTSEQIKSIKDTYEYYIALGGGF